MRWTRSGKPMTAFPWYVAGPDYGMLVPLQSNVVVLMQSMSVLSRYDRLTLFLRPMQMMSATGHPDLVTGMTDSWWRLVRKGVAPAFSPANIRWGLIMTASMQHVPLSSSARHVQGCLSALRARCRCSMSACLAPTQPQCHPALSKCFARSTADDELPPTYGV